MQQGQSGVQVHGDSRGEGQEVNLCCSTVTPPSEHLVHWHPLGLEQDPALQAPQRTGVMGATQLMGCETTISGVSSAIAQTIVDLGIDVGNVRTTSTMRDALADAVAALDQRQYDVVLMDIQMPRMDGVAATRAIRARFPMEQQPRIIAVTANALVGDRERFLEAGMDDYLSKPVKRQSLAAKLAAVASAKLS